MGVQHTQIPISSQVALSPVSQLPERALAIQAHRLWVSRSLTRILPRQPCSLLLQQHAQQVCAGTCLMWEFPAMSFSFRCRTTLLLRADNHKLQLAAVIGSEIGGGNGVEPLLIGSRLQLPIVDADYMGRAFPELQVLYWTKHLQEW